MCSTHFIITTVRIKSNLSKWPQLLVIIFWRHLKTKEKKEPKPPKLAPEQQCLPRDQWAAGRGCGRSSSPMSLALPHGVLGRWQGGRTRGTGRVQRASEKELFHGCVQGKAERPLTLPAYGVAQPTGFCADTPQSPGLQQVPSATEKAKGGGTGRAVGYSFWPGASEPYSQMSDPAGRAPPLPRPSWGAQPFPALGPPSLWSLSAV